MQWKDKRHEAKEEEANANGVCASINVYKMPQRCNETNDAQLEDDYEEESVRARERENNEMKRTNERMNKKRSSTTSL